MALGGEGALHRSALTPSGSPNLRLPGRSSWAPTLGCWRTGQQRELEFYHLQAKDLIDAQGVAELLGLARRNTVSAYQCRCLATSRPIVGSNGGRCKLCLRSGHGPWRSERLTDPAQ